MGEDIKGKDEIDVLMKKLPEFDYSKALAYCAGSRELLSEILKDYVGSKRADVMELYFMDEDWENYRIEAHALKSTSLTIGLNSLSDEAKGLEFAAKDGDISYIENNHIKVMLHYKKVLMIMKEIF